MTTNTTTTIAIEALRALATSYMEREGAESQAAEVLEFIARLRDIERSLPLATQEGLSDEERSLAHRGLKIDTIKAWRTRTGGMLKEGNEIVTRYFTKHGIKAVWGPPVDDITGV